MLWCFFQSPQWKASSLLPPRHSSGRCCNTKCRCCIICTTTGARCHRNDRAATFRSIHYKCSSRMLLLCGSVLINTTATHRVTSRESFCLFSGEFAQQQLKYHTCLQSFSSCKISHISQFFTFGKNLLLTPLILVNLKNYFCSGCGFCCRCSASCAVPWPTTEVSRGTRSPRRPLLFGRTGFVHCDQRWSPRSRNQWSILPVEMMVRGVHSRNAQHTAQRIVSILKESIFCEKSPMFYPTNYKLQMSPWPQWQSVVAYG